VILLDTHAAVWFANDDPRLGKRSTALAEAALSESVLAISAVSFWEIALLVSKNRLELRADANLLRRELLAAGITELPLTGDAAILAVGLASLHSDPADRFIAATAIAHNATLMTADAALLRWPHSLLRQNAAT
jgi:PIN domain nuclease of toxin-antitoxin system